MALTHNSTITEVRESYYLNMDYDVGVGDALQFRRAAQLLLEMIPSRSSNKDGDIEMNLEHIRDQLDAVNEYIGNNLVVALPTGVRRVKYLRPTRG